MLITVNERQQDVPEGTALRDIRSRFKPEADIVIVNGAVQERDGAVAAGDAVILIRRGEQPGADELEALMMARHTPGVHRKLKRACVGIAGLGGLGSTIAVALARVGVGRLILVDFDVVEPSNLNRQQYFIDQIGMRKTEALVANLMRINPYVAYEPHAVRLGPENIPVIFRGVDVLLEAFDQVDMKAMLAEHFGAAFPDTPLVMASGLAGCGPENTLRVRKCGRHVYVVGDLESAARPGCGLMAPRVGIVAHMQANLAVRLLLGDEA